MPLVYMALSCFFMQIQTIHSDLSEMATMKESRRSDDTNIYDDYFRMVQSKKKLPHRLQDSLTSSFGKIPVASFPQVPGGKVIEILADTTICDAVEILSNSHILAAPVVNPACADSIDWRKRYLGILDYSAVILWVLENAGIAAAALSASAAVAAGVGTGAAGALGAMAIGVTGPVAVAGLAAVSVGAAVAGGVAADKGMARDAPSAADKFGKEFYNVILHEEPFKSAKVTSIVKSYRWAPFVPVAPDSSMLSVLLLLSKYRLRNVPVIETGNAAIKNFITQSAVIRGLQQCRGRDWFDCIASYSLSELGLPFMSSDQIVTVGDNELILEAFKRMKDKQIGGLPVTEGSTRKLRGNLSIRDIRFLLLHQELFSNFRHLTVKDFIAAVAIANNDTGRMVRAITCKQDSTIGSAIDTLVCREVHRIYMVGGSEDEIIGVVTLRDVISCFINEPPGFCDDYFGYASREMSNR